MEEIVFYDDGRNKVTNSRFIVGGQTYALSGITSVRIARTDFKPPAYKNWVGIIAFGFVAAPIAAIFTGDAFKGFMPIIQNVLSVGIGIALFKYHNTIKNPNSDYHVVTTSSSGENEALTSSDRELVQKIVNALNEAIVSRG